MKTIAEIRRNHRAGTSGNSLRRGAAAVEFACLFPIIVMMLIGIAEIGRANNAGAQLTSAVREAGRLASMDIRDMIPEGMTANQKIASDVRQFLNLAGFPGDTVEVTITHSEGSKQGQTFDLEDPENYLKLLTIEAAIPYEEISAFPIRFMRGRDITATITFRRGRVSMSE
jgi:pimeloyl-ACP methyl ester carboxylesterase